MVRGMLSIPGIMAQIGFQCQSKVAISPRSCCHSTGRGPIVWLALAVPGTRGPHLFN